MRIIHRDLSFFFSGMIIIYAVSGIVMNHRDKINPDYSIDVKRYTLDGALPEKGGITKEQVMDLLRPIDEADNYTKHYFPEPHIMKVFLRGGSNLRVDLSTQEVVYEQLTRRHILSAMTKLHYNPGRWWTTFADCFGIALILITLTGIFMMKGRNGLMGRGGIELIAGILVPLAFLLL